MEMHRNTRCWCGSGKKYKQCHEKFDLKLAELARAGKTIPDRSLIKSEQDIQGIKKSSKNQHRSIRSCCETYQGWYEHR